MAGMIDSLTHVFEILVQGVLALVVLSYVLSTQRRWKWLFEDFIRRVARSFRIALRIDRATLHKLLLVSALGAVYFMGILANLLGFALMRPAHHAIIQDVYEAARFVRTLRDTRGGGLGLTLSHVMTRRDSLKLRGCPQERSVVDLSRLIAGELAWNLGHPSGASAALHGVEPARWYYESYMEDEMTWRNEKRETAAGSLDPLLKQSRVARGTTVAALLMFGWAIVKLAVFFVCLFIILVGRRLGERGVGRWVVAAVHWLNRRFIRDDEGKVIGSGAPLEPMPLEKIEVEARRLLWTNGVVALASATVFVLAVGAYKMVEREYHLEAIYGSRSAKPPTTAHPVTRNDSPGRPAREPHRPGAR